mgnify:FL=1
MDRSNNENIIAKTTSEEDVKKVRLILSNQNDVPDPYYDEAEGFENCFTLLDDACHQILNSLHNESR